LINKEYKLANFSLEYFPPGDQAGLKNLSNQARVMSAYSPLYMSITHSAKGAEINETMHTVQILKEQLSVEISPHMTCSSYSKAEIIKMAEDYLSLGVESVVALRGNLREDINIGEPYFDNSPDFINALSKKFDFRISISGYPEGHPEQRNDAADLQYLRKKCDAGADEIITQWFFSNNHLLQYRDQCDAAGINISIVPGILPISDIRKVKNFARACGSLIPKELEAAFLKVDDDMEATEELGVHFAIQQIENLHKEGIDNFHLYTLNRSKMTKRIIEYFVVSIAEDRIASEKIAS
jgi:methylenetetrahydrofolate reductase (NADPH)|tara:strand:- start:24 stop:911 length:888 start_codon:yes stop_codon:yes gene_type:complete